MDPMEEDNAPGPEIGRFEMHLITPPMLFGCERMPFLVWLGVIAFLVVAVFGITPWGLIGGALMLAGGILWLRDIARDDPQWFAMRLERMKYPTHMPDVLPDTRLKDWDFVGFDDPPAPETVLKAWLGVSAAALAPAALVALFFGVLVGGLTFAGLMLAAALWVFQEKLIERARRMR
ncbi:VirB3 family type IV secretion system protein [Ruegeria atlantica]|uniref:VirB3 family type IV secretion system protein n=1 Tax=Ruegeria atlantica TaxID=81569 RepID=UPI00147B3511|nr:VirB3 family type IV secretion system protein [Ruegeria atlantica]